MVCMETKKSGYDGIDRRKYPRVNAQVKYQILEKIPADKFSNTKNISAGGIAFFATASVQISSILSLSISLPDATEFQAMARVIWQERVQVSWDTDICWELGVQFIEIDNNDRKKISKYAFLRLNKS